MEITKFYVIETGRKEESQQADWYGSLALKDEKDGFKSYQFNPFEYPIYTTFEEAERSCTGDWQGVMYEYCDNVARILEYSANEETGGYYQLTHVWNYTHEMAVKQGSNSVYTLVSEKAYPYSLYSGVSDD